VTKKKYGLPGQGQTQPKISPEDISVIRFGGVKVRIVKISGYSRDTLKALNRDEKNTVALTYGIRGKHQPDLLEGVSHA
jgi:hypothetical protein